MNKPTTTTQPCEQPSDDELFASLRSNAEMLPLLRELARISLDADESSANADLAEERIEQIGQQLKLAAMHGWARQACSKRAEALLDSGAARKRGGKNA